MKPYFFLCDNPNCPFTEPHWHGFEPDEENPGNYVTTTHWVPEAKKE